MTTTGIAARRHVAKCACADPATWWSPDAVLVVAVRDGPLAILRVQAIRLLKRLAVLGRLTVGKLAEAIGVDYARHRRAWRTTWLT